MSNSLVACTPAIQPVGPLGQTATNAETRVEKRQILSEYLALQKRLLSIEYPLLTANADLCYADVEPRLGFSVLSEADFSDQWREAAQLELELGPTPQIVYVTPRSAAERAGLTDGDRLTGFNGRSLPPGQEGRAVLVNLEKNLIPGAPYELVYERDGESHTTRITPELACAFRFIAIRGDQMEILVSGERVLVTAETMRFLPVDDDLAAVIAIELIRDVRNHEARRRINTVGAYVGDIALVLFLGINTNGSLSHAAAEASEANYAEEADHLTLYVLARAGYDYRRLPELLERIADDVSGSISDDYQISHPLTLDRYVAVDAAVRDLEAKEARGAPLVPDDEFLANYAEIGNEDREREGTM